MNESCIACGKQYIKEPIVYETPLLLVAKCPSCGMAWSVGTFSDEILEDDFDYWGQDTYVKYDLQFRKEAETRLALISRYKNGDSILDIGCGVGIFLEVAEQQGWKVSGLDISRCAIKQANHRLKVGRAYAILIEDADYLPASFDIITLWNVMEHISRPIESLEKMIGWLKPNGLIAIEIPQEDSMAKLLNSWIYRLSLGRLHMVHYLYGRESGGHLFSYTGQSLRNIFAKRDFRILHYEHHNSNMEILLDKYKKNKSHTRLIAERTFIALINAIASLTNHQNRLMIVFERTS